MQVLIIIGLLWMPESPEFYFAKGRFDESKIVLLHIARVNKQSVSEEMINFDQVTSNDSYQSITECKLEIIVSK